MHQVVIRTFLLCVAVALPGTAGAQQASETGRIGAVNSVIEYRIVFMDDTTRFDACSVHRWMGRPDTLAAVLTRRSRRVVAPVEAPCERASAAPAQRPSRVVRVDSVAVADTTAHVFLTVFKGETRVFEKYDLRAYSPGPGWGINTVTLTGALRITPGSRRPPTPPRGPPR